MPEQVIFELLLVRRAAGQQPVGAGVTDAVAEQQVQSPSHLVDEIVHIAVERAVVIAREEHLPAIVQKHPSCEVDRMYPTEMAAVVNMARAVIDDPQQEDHGREPEPAWLQITQHDVRVGDIVILQRGYRFPAPRIGPRQDFRIAGLVAPQ